MSATEIRTEFEVLVGSIMIRKDARDEGRTYFVWVWELEAHVYVCLPSEPSSSRVSHWWSEAIRKFNSLRRRVTLFSHQNHLKNIVEGTRE